MTARIDALFARLRAEDRAAFVAYVMAGDPDREQSLATLHALAEAGADMIELGFPFSDPIAEGVPIQRAAQRSLKAGMTLAGTLELARAFRESAPPPLIPANAGTQAFSDPSAGQVSGVASKPSDEKSLGPRVRGDERSEVPLILMGYLNPIESYGLDKFAREAGHAGIDGVIVVDCPPEEADPLADALDAHGIALIRLATPTTDAARLPMVLRRTSGFVYYVSVAGVTGQKAAEADVVAPAVARIRAASGLPVAVGFGIRTPEQAAAVARIADASVVGSALVDEVALAVEAGEAPAARVGRLAAELARAVRSARTPHG